MIVKAGFATLILGFVLVLFTGWDGHYQSIDTKSIIAFSMCTLGALGILIGGIIRK